MGNDWLPIAIPLAAGALMWPAGRWTDRPKLWGPLGTVVLLACAASLVSAAGTGNWTPFAVGCAAMTIALAIVRNLSSWNAGDSARPAVLQATLSVGTAGVLLAVVADDVAAILLGLELCGFAGAAMVRWGDAADRSPAPARTALAVHVVGTALLATAFVLLAATAGSTSVSQIGAAFLEAVPGADSAGGAGVRVGNRSTAAQIAFVLLFAGLATRLGLAPFHFGAPDVLADSSPAAGSYFAALPRLAAAVVLFRIGLQAMAGFESKGVLIALTLSAGTLTVFPLLAIAQTTLRRTLAYLALGQSGFVSLGFAVAWGGRLTDVLPAPTTSPLTAGEVALSLAGLSGWLSLAGIAALLAFLRSGDRNVEFADQLKGLLHRRPLAGSALVLLLLNLAGAPPLPGFWSKLSLLLSALSLQRETADGVVLHPAGLTAALLVAASAGLTGIVALRLLAVILFEPPLSRSPADGGTPALAAGLLCALLLLASGLTPARTTSLLDRITRPGVADEVTPAGGGGRNRRTIGRGPEGRDQR